MLRRMRAPACLLPWLLAGCAVASRPPPTAAAPSAVASAPEPEPAPPGPPPPGPPPSGPAPLAPPPAPEPIPREAISRLGARLDAILGRVQGARVGAVILDAGSGQQVYAASPAELLIPASNTKLFTTAAALSLLGATYRMTTRIEAKAEPVDGVVEEVFLRGNHDVSWSRLFGPEPEASLSALARALRERGVRSVSRAVWITGEPLWDADRFDELNLDAHRNAVAWQLRRALDREHIRVAAVRPREAPGADLPVALAEVSSEPLLRVCTLINQLSHNGFADALLRHLGQTRGGSSSYAAGARVVQAWLDQIGLKEEGLQLVDGSGLSRGNLVSARSLARLLLYMEKSALAAEFRATLATSDGQGTLRGRFAKMPGKVYGKTGTLAQVVATSGLLQHASDGRTYVFALVSNGRTEGAAMRKVHDRLLAELASGWGPPAGAR